MSIRLQKRWLRRLLRLGVPLLTIAAVALLTAETWLPAMGHWLAQPSRLHKADAIVVLGGATRRSEHGITLYHEGFAPRFWHTGAVSPAEEVSYFARAARQKAIASGIPADVIVLLETTSTWEDGAAIAAQAAEQNTDSILLVTDWYHSRRALCVVQRHLADQDIAIYYEPPPARYGPGNWWREPDTRQVVLAEYLKLPYYWLRYGVAPRAC
ncbi:MAG: YdcF family protein [Chloroflexaceae bacterium]|nr:YdcF family protein [Chloroflexaceae bacterium]NJL34736.1 YdcF family protein [Chloroflexaceae bacterium]NJO04518.1 YdcF family protein [Chloroflexaceae bacterium]